MAVPAAALRRWSLEHVVPVADTATSRVYRADRSDGTPVALKVLKPYGADEIRGASLLAWYGGVGAVTLLDRHDNMILMEWLDGEPLGDRVRAGHDDDATAILCDVVARLQQPRDGLPGELTPLRGQFGALLDGGLSWWPESHRDLAARAASLATALLDDAVPQIPLHGDLHHDNVLYSPRGWLAIDPKGLVGDAAYETANVFRNPIGAEDLAMQPRRIDALARAFATRLRLDPKRVLSWASTQTALSACWDNAAGNPVEHDLAMLPVLLAAADRA